MAINMVVLSGTVERPAVRIDDAGKVELRFTLKQSEGPFHLYIPCCAAGSAAERLSGEITEHDQIVISSSKLCWRKRATKSGELLSRMEVLVWQVDVMDRRSETTSGESSGAHESHDSLDDPALAVATPGPSKRQKRPKTGKFGAGPYSPN